MQALVDCGQCFSPELQLQVTPQFRVTYSVGRTWDRFVHEERLGTQLRGHRPTPVTIDLRPKASARRTIYCHPKKDATRDSVAVDVGVQIN